MLIFMMLAGCGADLVWEGACEGGVESDHSRFDFAVLHDGSDRLLCLDDLADIDAEGMSATVGEDDLTCNADDITTWVDVATTCPPSTDRTTVEIWGVYCGVFSCDEPYAIRSLELQLR